MPQRQRALCRRVECVACDDERPAGHWLCAALSAGCMRDLVTPEDFALLALPVGEFVRLPAPHHARVPAATTAGVGEEAAAAAAAAVEEAAFGPGSPLPGDASVRFPS